MVSHPSLELLIALGWIALVALASRPLVELDESGHQAARPGRSVVDLPTRRP